MWETWVWSLGWEDPLEKGMANHSRTLAWRIPWTEEPGRLQSMGSQRVRHDLVTFIFFSASYVVDTVGGQWSLYSQSWQYGAIMRKHWRNVENSYKRGSRALLNHTLERAYLVNRVRASPPEKKPFNLSTKGEKAAYQVRSEGKGSEIQKQHAEDHEKRKLWKSQRSERRTVCLGQRECQSEWPWAGNSRLWMALYPRSNVSVGSIYMPITCHGRNIWGYLRCVSCPLRTQILLLGLIGKLVVE